jgi:hypothetical protein
MSEGRLLLLMLVRAYRLERIEGDRMPGLNT